MDLSNIQHEEEGIFDLLQLLNKGVTPAFARCAGTSPTRVRLLHGLFSAEEISQTALQKTLEIDGAAITRHLKALEEQGMVARRSNPADNRVTLVSLTDEGRKHVHCYKEEKSRFISGLLAGFAAEERAALKGMLLRLHDNMNVL
ncbi:MarR family winged helix-turn-helix transcriptional regulator ['Paenibacillus yunnanensis' Narsing Rao et al. 2020]|uniref:MarR family winged helix-turn-helix transcriptional regulator n=1 Tax=Paenibacillus tengchongensis TaxID=2608684 RepID=UPI00124D26ED|nr:MarR family transcriptional regulator [Paenibacillus tengchongensis]